MLPRASATSVFANELFTTYNTRRLNCLLPASGKAFSYQRRSKASVAAYKPTSAPPPPPTPPPPTPPPPRPTTVPTTTTSTLATNRLLNPPATTRPPALTLPTKDGAIPLYKHYFNIGKAYLTFYKTGLTGIYTNYQTAKGLPNCSFHPLFASRETIFAAALAKKLSRADLQLLLRLRADTKVLPVFALVFLCCGEFTPLLVPFLTAIVPPSVHIPSQTSKLRRNAEKLRQQAKDGGPPEWRSIQNIWELQIPRLDDKVLRPVEQRMARELALYPPWWERLPFYMSFVKRRLELRLDELRVDDEVIIRDGGVRGMIAEEVKMACERRGLVVEGKAEENLRRSLAHFIKKGNGESAKELVLRVNGK